MSSPKPDNLKEVEPTSPVGSYTEKPVQEKIENVPSRLSDEESGEQEFKVFPESNSTYTFSNIPRVYL